MINLGGDNMYSLNCLIIYSILGFLLESTIYKVKKSKRHSGICFGPLTYVYGFGVLGLNLLDQYFLPRIKGNRFFKGIITFFSCAFLMSIIEWLGGVILYALFQVRLWDYSKKAYNMGPYVCLELSFIWGILGCFYLYFVKKHLDPLISKIPKKVTLILTFLELVDIIFVFLVKFF